MTISSRPQSNGHIVLFAYEAWGHTRPLCNFAARIVKTRAIQITFLTPETFVDRVKLELLRSFDPEESNLAELIRVVGLFNKAAHPLDHSVLNASFVDTYERLVNSETVICTRTAVQYEALPSPDAAVIDFIASAQLEAIRKLSKNPIKIFAWYSPAASALFSFCGPESMGGKGDLLAKVKSEVKRTGKPLAQVTSDIVLACNGSVIEIPGLPPMYDHEFYPQRIPIREAIGLMYLSAYVVLDGCDSVILSTPECLEPDAIHAARKLFAEKSRNVHVCGPLLPSGSRASEHDKEQSQKATEIENFMDHVLETRGKNSLLYISFGSLFWSSQPEKIWAMLDVVMEMKIPFIMSHASKVAIIPDDVTAKIKEYGLGVMSPWCPQQLILAHRVTGWFMTHCGHNGVVESISQGVPMICWPWLFDQPMNAAYLTYNLGVAYEIFEVRTAEGLKPIRRMGRAPEGTVEAVRSEATEVFKKAFGEDGSKKRANVQRFKQRFKQTWSEAGEAKCAVEAFLSESLSRTVD